VGLTLVSLLVLGAPTVEMKGCESQLSESFTQQIELEWRDPPAGAQVEVRCDSRWIRLHLEAPDFTPVTEEVRLPQISLATRSRLLALLIAERGRGLRRVPSPAKSGTTEVLPSVEVTPIAPEPSRSRTPHTGALWAVDTGENPSALWRLSVGSSFVSPLWLGPWRIGPRVGIRRGPFALALCATFGQQNVSIGSIQAQAYSVEPEVTGLAIRSRWVSASLGARAILGYGILRGITSASATGDSVGGALLGGVGVLSVTLRMTARWALDVEGNLGGAWAPWARAGGEGAAALGREMAAVSASVVMAWGEE
jgi:hypothetical protein